MIQRVFGTALVALWPCIGLAADPACYALDKTGVGAVALDDLVISGAGDITFTYAGFPQVPYEDDCNIEGRRHATCPLDCDGGTIRLIRMEDGLVASFSRRIEAVRFDSVVTAGGAFDAAGQSLVGTYFLRPAPEATCREIAARKPGIALQKGMHFPGVERLENGLSAAGYFTGVPDWTFTTETETALRAAQRDLGFADTGIADRAFMRVLAHYAAYAYGGC